MIGGSVRRRSGRPGFVEPGRARTALVVALGANAALAWAVILGFSTFLDRLWRDLGGRLVPGTPLETHWNQLEAARRIQGLAWLATAALFLLWLHRVYGNLAWLGAHRMRFSARWAVGTFFVPAMNLVWPYLVVREVWTGSDPGAAADGTHQPPRGAPWVLAWWILFVAAALLDPGPWRLVEDLRHHLGLGGPTVVLLTAQIAEIAAAVLAIVLVLRVDERQGLRLRALDQA